MERSGTTTYRVGGASPTVPAGSGTMPSLSQVAPQAIGTPSDSQMEKWSGSQECHGHSRLVAPDM